MAVIVGDPSDPHVAAVSALLQEPPTILDAASLSDRPLVLAKDGLRVGGSEPLRGRAWLRRLAAPAWAEDVGKGGPQAARKASWLSALAAFLRDDRVEWLTSLDSIAATESKPLQYRLVEEAGCPVPEWLVTTDRDLVARGDWVVKALGPGHFFAEDGKDLVVPTTPLEEHHLPAVKGAPFVYQTRVEARTHARIVTVGGSAFSSTLSAADLPLDWRASSAAHRSFTAQPAPERVLELALLAAGACHVGYSSQDWIEDASGNWWFVDLNPAGQWLFLPAEVGVSVARAIATWLEDRRVDREQ